MTNKEFDAIPYIDKIKHNLPAIIAFTNGEAIEATVTGSNEYYETKSLNYVQNFPHRVKPKTVKRWYNIYLDGSDTDKLLGYGYISKDMADIASGESRLSCVEIEVPIEV